MCVCVYIYDFKYVYFCVCMYIYYVFNKIYVDVYIIFISSLFYVFSIQLLLDSSIYICAFFMLYFLVHHYYLCIIIRIISNTMIVQYGVASSLNHVWHFTRLRQATQYFMHIYFYIFMEC